MLMITQQPGFYDGINYV